MAGDQEKAALRAHIVTLETRVQETEGSAARKEHTYIVKTQVFDECFPAPTSGEPPLPTEPEGGASVHARLDRIEAQLQRIIAKLEV